MEFKGFCKVIRDQLDKKLDRDYFRVSEGYLGSVFGIEIFYKSKLGTICESMSLKFDGKSIEISFLDSDFGRVDRGEWDIGDPKFSLNTIEEIMSELEKYLPSNVCLKKSEWVDTEYIISLQDFQYNDIAIMVVKFKNTEMEIMCNVDGHQIEICRMDWNVPGSDIHMVVNKIGFGFSVVIYSMMNKRINKIHDALRDF